MKKNYNFTFSLLLTLASTLVQAQVPNSDFEMWAGGNPDNWRTTNLPPLVTNITAVTPAQSGSFAAKGEVVDFSGSPYSPVLSSTDAAFNGFPVSQSYDHFSFYYKMNITSTAVFEVTIALYDASNGYVGGYVRHYAAGTVNTFTQENYTLDYIGTNPATCVIIFNIYDTVGSDPPIGNYFIVDNVALSGTVGINETTVGTPPVCVSPNPSRDLVAISLPGEATGKADISVYDLLGNNVKQFSAGITSLHLLDKKMSVADLPKGMYLLRINSGEKQWTGKFLKD